MSQREFDWPDGSQRPFAASDQNHLNADVVYDRSFYFYVVGYRRSTEMLFEAIAKGGYLDSQFFALAFLWRHTIELLIKHLHAALDRLDGIQRFRGPPRSFDARRDAPLHAPITGHNLQALWALLAHRLIALSPDERDLVNRSGEIIDQLHAIDPGADGFRYPTKPDGVTPSLSSIERLQNFENLHRSMLALANMLEAVSSEVQQRLDHVAEYERDYERG